MVLTPWWCPRVELSLVLLEEGICYDQCVLLAKLCYPLLCFTLYSKSKLACYSRYLLTSYFCISILLWWKWLFFFFWFSTCLMCKGGKKAVSRLSVWIHSQNAGHPKHHSEQLIIFCDWREFQFWKDLIPWDHGDSFIVRIKYRNLKAPSKQQGWD